MRAFIRLLTLTLLAGCHSGGDIVREYRQAFAYIDSSVQVRNFVDSETLPEWGHPAVAIFDTAFYAVANRGLDRYFSMKERSASSDSIKWRRARKAAESAIKDKIRIPIPTTISHPVSDSSRFVIFFSPDIYGLMVAELLPINCNPQCDPRNYAASAMFSRGLRMNFIFDDTGVLQSIDSYVVQR